MWLHLLHHWDADAGCEDGGCTGSSTSAGGAAVPWPAWGWVLPPAPPPPGTASGATQPSLDAFTLVGLDADEVGPWNSHVPDGHNDGHFTAAAVGGRVPCAVVVLTLALWAMELRQDKLYRVESAQDHTVRLALSPHIHHQELRWFDTVRARAKPGRVASDDAVAFVWAGVDGARYRFTVVSLAEYLRDLRALVELRPVFHTDADMHRFFVNQFAALTGAPVLPPPAGVGPSSKPPTPSQTVAARPGPKKKRAP